MFGTLLASGIATGLIYALIAIGIVVLVKATDGINFAHGDFATLGGFLAYAVVVGRQGNFASAFTIATLVVTVAGLMFFMLCRPLFASGRGPSLLIATIGLSFVVKGVIRVVWGGTGDYLPVPPLSDAAPLELGSIVVPAQQLAVAAGATVVLALFAMLFRWTSIGLQMRAAADNARAATLVGIRQAAVLRLAFVLSLAVAALSGVLIAPTTLLYADLGFSLFVKGFAAALLGGIYSLPGAVLGGVLVGAIETLSAGYIATQFQEVAAFVVIMATLVFLPGGLLGHVPQRKV